MESQEPETETKDFTALIYTTCITLAALASHYFQRGLRHEEAIYMLIFFIAGLSIFWFALIRSVAKPIMNSKEDWKALECMRPIVEARLYKYMVILCLHFATLIMVYLSKLLRGYHFGDTDEWLQHGYLFTGTLCFLAALRLPFILGRTQLDRIDLKIDDKIRPEKP